jgi:hypothetical protein
MDYSFPHYLLAKRTVDDRAINRLVMRQVEEPESRKTSFENPPYRVIELGAGIGTMLARLQVWEFLPARAEYILVDEMPENIAYAHDVVEAWAGEHGWKTEKPSAATWRITRQCQVKPGEELLVVNFVCADMFAYIESQLGRQPADLLIAHAVLDLLPLPESLPRLFSLLKPGGKAWLTLNFDGVTSFEPAIDPELDALIEHLYHQSMDTRPTGGDSRCGRHLFAHLAQSGARIAAAGSSDWVVYPMDGKYPHNEAYFLHFILHFFEESLANHPLLDQAKFARWLCTRREQIERGELVYIAHQMDFACYLPGSGAYNGSMFGESNP